MKIKIAQGEFELNNEEKVNRAIYGTMSRGGVNAGGVGEKATPAEIIAEYDRLGGGIFKEGNKVKMGCFYNFKERRPEKEPKIVLLFPTTTIKGDRKIIEVAEGTELPLAVKAQKMADEAAKEEALKEEENKAEKKGKKK